MQRCETNENADLLVKIEILSVTRTYDYDSFAQRFTTTRYKIIVHDCNSSSANFNFYFEIFLSHYICIISIRFLSSKIRHYTTNFQATFNIYIYIYYYRLFSLTNFSYIYRENKINRANM